MFIFNSLSIVIFLVLALDQNRKLPHVMMAWVEFNSFFFFINPSWDKAGSHICKHSSVLKQMIKKGNISDTTRRDFFFTYTPTRREKELSQTILKSPCMPLLGENCPV